MVGVRWVESTDRKRSHRKKNDQKKRRQTSRSEVSAAEAAAAASLADVMAGRREGLLALAVQSGLGVMQAQFNQDVDRLCGLSGKDNSDRQGYLNGRTDGIVGLGGRRIPITRARVRRGWLGRVASGQLRGTAGHRPPGANGAGAHDRGTLHAERPVRSGAGRCGGGGTLCRYGEVLALPSLHRPDGDGAGRAPRSPAERGGPGRGWTWSR